MRLILVAGAAGMLLLAGAPGPAAVWQAVQQIYPSDPLRRQALDQCFLADHRFDRLDGAAREECYRRFTAAQARSGSVGRPMPNGNFVDLWRAARQGRLPHEDIRFEEQMARYYHPIQAAPLR